ncbi:MAG: PDZ domain-containing protein [Ruminococcus sp.]|nr:PDZ domain-containing protein [Ruminococcus sp.]HRR77979.1 S41 family peptidase [Ruminococcus sp.]
MNKKISLGLAISLMAIASAVTFILTSFFSLQSYNKKVVDVNEKSKKYNSLQHIDSFVRDNYYGDIDEKELNNGILKGYVSGLGDEFSEFLSEEEYKDEQTSDAGEVIGLGLFLAEDDSGYIRIDKVLDDSPAAEAQLQAGDVITSVSGVDVVATGFDEAMEAINGSEGTNVELVVRHNGIDTSYSFTRRSIELVTVTGTLVDGYIGYIRIDSFKQNTPEQFVDVLQRMISNGAEALIFDVRDNNGGIMDALQDCLDPLLPEGVIATAEYKDGHTETVIYSDDSKIDLPAVVLVNKNTSSEAELFAVSLRDYSNAKLVGTKTKGKGVMQSVTEFENGGAVKLTVAEISNEVSGSFNGSGITPEVQLENDSPDYDAQYYKAIDTINTMLSE